MNPFQNVISKLRLLPILLLLAISPTQAVETVTNGNATFNTNDNISSYLSGWSSGWGSGTNTGWNYVGSITNGSASGTYLGNGWVLTAAHVGPLPLTSFTLDGNVYDSTGVSYSNFTNSLTGSTNADLNLFQSSTISTTGSSLTLPDLTLTSNAPTSGKEIVMIGYGGASGFGSESWGTSSVFLTNQPFSVYSWNSVDFTTVNTNTNYSTVILGDSGGGDFIKVGSTWELAGINEALVSYNSTNPNTGTNYTGSAFVQLSAYDSQLAAIVNSVPEPDPESLVRLGMIFVLGFSLWKSRWRNS